MNRRVFVPLDGSDFGEGILPFATTVARSLDAEVDVAHVHVAHLPDHLLANTQYQFEGVDMEEYDLRDRSDEKAYLERVSRELSQELDRPVHPVLLSGQLPEAIEAYVQKEGPRLIVMTTHGRTGMSRAWLGSVADALVRHAPCPVLLVRPSREGLVESVRIRRLLIPLDGSERSEKILAPATELARGGGASVLLLTVVSPNTVLGTRVLPVSMAARAEARRRANGYLDGVAGRLDDELEIETRVVDHPQAARGILAVMEAEDPDVVAMSTHGYRGMRRAVLGSVADKVIRASDTPLLLVGPGVEA